VTLRLITHNVFWLQGMPFLGDQPGSADPDVLDALSRLYVDLQPDVLCLQEVQSRGVVEALAAALGLGWCYAPGGRYPQYGAAVLSRWEMEVRPTSPALLDRVVLRVRVQPVGHASMLISNVHLPSNRQRGPEDGAAQRLAELPASFAPGQVVAVVLVSGGVLWALRDAFGDMGRRGVVLRVVGVAAGNGLLTIATALLAARAVGVVETYVVRTAMAAMVTLSMFPPRDVPLRSAPRLLFRSVLTTTSFVFIILGVQHGSPVVVQTMVAITPLFVLAAESYRTRTRPPRRALGAAVLVAAGVAIVLAT